MANNIIQKTYSENGKTKTANELIRDLLRREGGKTFGQIKSYLSNKQIRYHDNKGLALALSSMQKRNQIEKHLQKPYPLYYYVETGIDSIEYLGDEFSRLIPGFLNKYPNLHTHSKSSVSDFVSKLTNLFGIYTFFVLIHSWKLTDSSYSHTRNSQRRSTWLQNTLVFPYGSSLLDEGIIKLLGLADHDEQIARIYESKKKKTKLMEIEKILKKQHPDEISFFSSILQQAETEYPKTRRWIKEMEMFDAWVERLNRKMKKHPKTRLKPNECPRCHYDGSTEVKIGPCKGATFERGFSLESDNNHRGRHCLACDFWESV